MHFPRGRGVRIVAVWLGVAVFFGAQNALVRLSRGGGLDWQWDVYHEVIYALTWAICTPLVLAAARRWRLEPGTGFGGIAPHLITMVVLAPLQITASYTFHYGILAAVGAPPAAGWGEWYARIAPGLVWGTFTGFMYYWLIIGVHAAFTYPRLYQAERLAAAELSARASRLEGRLAEARLDALRRQLHPHFLFNTLNAIAALTTADPPRAHRMLVRLGDLLRQTLAHDDAGEVPLEHELALLAPYLEIQQIRFGDRLRVLEEIAPEVRHAFVPTLLLQPLVENAVQHGVQKRPSGATIRLGARRANATLVVEVEDDGPGISRDAPVAGIGLANTRARLAQLYGDAHRLDLESMPAGGTRVRVELPFRVSA